MPNTSGTSKKKTSTNEVTEANRQNNSSSSNNISSSSNASGGSVHSRARKRKREKAQLSDSDLGSELVDCNMEDAIAIEKKLRKVAKANELSDEEMRRLLQKFVKNEHVLAWVTLKAEDELARERLEAEQRAIIITDTPSVLKLTRAKARELNKTPGLTLPPLSTDAPQPDIAALIKDDLHSDEEDEEYTFKEEDFISDDDPNTTVSDMDSNPCTPQTPLPHTEGEDSPVKLTVDGCFKIPFDKQEDFRIAGRTRSKLCLQQTTIEDIQSEFVPPDVDLVDLQEMHDMAATDEEWMQFLNDFSKPLNNTLVGDDDDPINDPEYVAAEKIPMDAEELRDVNIPKKELTDLVAELFEELVNEGVSLESIELQTPLKYLQYSEPNVNSKLNTPNVSPEKLENANPSDGIGAAVGTDGVNVTTTTEEHTQVMRRINFDAATQQACVSDTTISSTNVTQNECSFDPIVTSTPGAVAFVATTKCAQLSNTIVPIAYNIQEEHNSEALVNSTCKPIFISDSALHAEPQIVAIPVPGQPNCFQLAKVLATGRELEQSITLCSPDRLQRAVEEPPSKKRKPDSNDPRYTTPYDTNFTWEYISIKKHIYSEYMDKFESLRHLHQSNAPQESDLKAHSGSGFTQAQHDMLQQQLRIHVQFLAQNFVQTYSHPELWKCAPKMKEMLLELQTRAVSHATFNAWNLQTAVELLQQWETELAQDTPENKQLMDFLHEEIAHTSSTRRQIPRFPPRIMELIVNSSAFMYPQYLPRMPFTPKVHSFHVFAPAESQLIALGLEKHMQRIRESGQRISKLASPLVLACGRISNDTIFGKTKRRIWDYIKVLRKTDYYNPVKYYFEHQRAPPVEQELITFENSHMLAPKDRPQELPLVWQKYLENKNNLEKEKPETNTPVVISEKARASYLEFVREAVDEHIQLPEHFGASNKEAYDLTTLTTATNETDTTNSTRSPKTKQKSKAKKLRTKPLTINVNYIFGANTTQEFSANNSQLVSSPNSTLCSTNYNLTTVNASQTSVPRNSPEALVTPTPIAYNFDYNTLTLQPVLQKSPKSDGTQRKLTDFYELEERGSSRNWEDLSSIAKYTSRKRRSGVRGCRKRLRGVSRKVAPRYRVASLKHRRKLYLQRRCHALLILHQQQLHSQAQRYQHSPLVHQYYKRFQALKLYTDLLGDLKMFCRDAALNSSGGGSPNASANTQGGIQSPGSFSKRARATMLDEEVTTGARSRKANRQEEGFRNMLLPDTPENTNRKDAIYAFNFYEKVEEVLKSSKHPEDCKKFNNLLKSFDPKQDKVADLYYQMEQLFLPDHPELAHVFLTFLLPSEAAEVGKYFEHFMITNMTTFISKLNVYFNKQPAQIRKIYNCLNDLAMESDVTTEKIKVKILPLLKGNQFLIDWFLQQFPEEAPSERLLPTPEHVNLKEAQNNQSGEFMETVTNILDSPTQEPTCQLRYINGRIFYGSKITLPAKLSFMAANCQEIVVDDVKKESSQEGCVHGIRDHGEKCIAAAAAAAANEANEAIVECNSDDNDKSEEEEVCKSLIIDTTTGEEDSCSSIETCDDGTLRSHAMRLNSSYYVSSCYNVTINAPNANQGASHNYHHSNVKKSEEGKVSPRKHAPLACSSSGVCTVGSNTNNTGCSPPSSTLTCAAATVQLREKRKSPTKKNKSPLCGISRPRVNQLPPMVVIHEHNAAIACAKKLKSLIEEDSESDIKNNLHIVARTKEAIAAEALCNLNTPSIALTQLVPKVEFTDDLEFLPENADEHASLSQSSFPALKVDSDSYDEEETIAEQQTDNTCVPPVSMAHSETDEDYKLDIVATLTTATDTDERQATTTAEAATSTTGSIVSSTSTTRCKTAWTREEDKIILIEMKSGSRERDTLFRRIGTKLPTRTQSEIAARHQFLMEFLFKLQGK